MVQSTLGARNSFLTNIRHSMTSLHRVSHTHTNINNIRIMARALRRTNRHTSTLLVNNNSFNNGLIKLRHPATRNRLRLQVRHLQIRPTFRGVRSHFKGTFHMALTLTSRPTNINITPTYRRDNRRLLTVLRRPVRTNSQWSRTFHRQRRPGNVSTQLLRHVMDNNRPALKQAAPPTILHLTTYFTWLERQILPY